MVGEARVIQVIEVSTTRGEGVEKDPVRSLVQYWSFNGNLLAEKDSLAPEYFRDWADGRLKEVGWVVSEGMDIFHQIGAARSKTDATRD